MTDPRLRNYPAVPSTGMNVCILCGGDGVLLTAGAWYCINHVDDAFIATAMAVARIKGSDEAVAEAMAHDLIRDL